jgi:hypothetical protein
MQSAPGFSETSDEFAAMNAVAVKAALDRAVELRNRKWTWTNQEL